MFERKRQCTILYVKSDELYLKKKQSKRIKRICGRMICANLDTESKMVSRTCDI